MILEATHRQDPNWFGEQLRLQREAAGISLDTITDEIKVAQRVLEALETGSFARLPERVFCRSFVAQYATVIGTDPDPLVEAFDHAWRIYEEESGEFQLPEARPAPPPRRPVRWGFWFPMAVGGVILVAAATVILSGSEPGQDVLVVATRPGIGTAAPTVTPTGIALVPAAPAATAQTQFGGDIVALTVMVDREKECWIHYRDREGRTEQRLLPGGSRLVLELEGPVKLTIGNAGAATLLVGGVEYAGLGVPGQVVHAEVSQDGVRTLGAGDLHG
jgi:cytoskeleton protein RodZ